MGDFAGYVLPGIVFLLFGLKWTIESIRERDPDEKGSAVVNRFRNIQRKLLCCRVHGLPAEGIIKLTIVSFGMAGSLIAAYPNGRLWRISDILYATIYIFFAISGLVDVLVYYRPDSMPLGIENITLSLSFLIEGLMFHCHLYQQSFMIQHIHTLLVYTIYSTAIVLLAEVVYPEVIAKFVRGFLTLLHGSWYVQTGFIIDSPLNPTPNAWSTGMEFDNALVGISLTFAWHAAVIFVLLLVLLIVMGNDHGKSKSDGAVPTNNNVPSEIWELEPPASISPSFTRRLYSNRNETMNNAQNNV